MKDFGEYLLEIGEKFDSGCLKPMREELGMNCDDYTCSSCHAEMMRRLYKKYRDSLCGQLPPGIEWPRYVNGRLIEVGDAFWCDHKRHVANEITFGIDGVSVGDCPCYKGNGVKVADSWKALAWDIVAEASNGCEISPEKAREWADRAADLQLGVE